MLKTLYKVLQENQTNTVEYSIPKIWNTLHINSKDLGNNLLEINPYEFYMKSIEHILEQKESNIDYSKAVNSLSKNQEVYSNYNPGDWIKDSTLYSAIVRTTTSWDHNNDKKLTDYNHIKETGTFVKSIAILPYLKAMGIDVFYMLPISKFSLKDKKGDLGSPYGVSNFYKIDPNLKDPITGDNLTIDDEFKAFVEACHILGIKVIIDIIPRTNAVENEFILTNPDWFYWIETKNKSIYKPPFVEELRGKPTPHDIPTLEICYASDAVKNHLELFVENPKQQDSAKWELFLERYYKDTNQSILDLIDEMFGLTIAPAFSDGINDPQPAWTDITFFRMYLDHPTAFANLVGANQAPYILFDTIKSNLFPGNLPNKELWNILSGIIPHYQTEYGIDGARIDMGHALPVELTNMIIEKARAVDPDFTFIAEDLSHTNCDKLKAVGYNLVIGNSIFMEYKFEEKKLQEFIGFATEGSLPLFAACETHDSGRVAAKTGGNDLARMLTVLNLFIPNTVPFINTGQEILEIQPINTGLDCRPNEAFLLPEDHPFYGKLALFDKFQFNYTNNENLFNDLKVASAVKNSIKGIKGEVVYNNEYIHIKYDNISIIANPNPINEVSTNLNLEGTVLYNSHNELTTTLRPAQIVIVK